MCYRAGGDSQCPWNKPVALLVAHLNEYIEMQDGGCPIGRHELLDEHWRLLGYMKNVREAYGMEQAEKAAARKRAEKEAQEQHG